MNAETKRQTLERLVLHLQNGNGSDKKRETSEIEAIQESLGLSAEKATEVHEKLSGLKEDD